MNGPPGGRWVTCPECGDTAVAIIPRTCEPVDEKEDADGKVWVNCHECEERFLVFYRTK